MTGDDAFVLRKLSEEAHPPSRLDGGDIRIREAISGISTARVTESFASMNL